MSDDPMAIPLQRSVPIFKRPVGSEVDTHSVFGHRFKDVEDNQEFSVEGATLNALFTPGHTAVWVGVAVSGAWLEFFPCRTRCRMC